MGSEWKLGLLSDIARFRTVKVAPKEIDVENYISTDNMAPNLGGIVGVSKLPKTGKVTIYKKGDVLFSNIRTYFRKVWLADKDGGCSNDVLVFSPKNTVPSEYLYYILSGNGFINYTVTTAKGTKMPRGDKQAIINYELSIAPKNFMEKIGNTLSTLDNKIQLNRETNKTLEAMAQALFKSWFVDFDPVIDNALAAGNKIPEPFQARAAARKAALAGLPKAQRALFPSEFEETEALGWVPKGWGVKSINQLVDTVSNTYPLKTVDSVIFLNTGDIEAGVFLHNNYSDASSLPGQAKKSIQRNDILYSEIRPKNKRFAYVNFESDDYVVSTKLMVLRSKGVVDSKFVYFVLSLEKTINELQSIAELRSGTFPQITFKELSDIKLSIPENQEVLKLFSDLILNKYFDKHFQLQSQNIELESLRDTLLPKLISGELRLPDADQQAEQQLNQQLEQQAKASD